MLREPKFSLLLMGHQFTLCERDGLFKVGMGEGGVTSIVTTTFFSCDITWD
jgi:hypothetical protein